MLHLFIQSSEEKHFPRQVSFIIDLLRNIQSNTGHTKASNMSWHPILGQGSKSTKIVHETYFVYARSHDFELGLRILRVIAWNCYGIKFLKQYSKSIGIFVEPPSGQGIIL